MILGFDSDASAAIERAHELIDAHGDVTEVNYLQLVFSGVGTFDEFNERPCWVATFDTAINESWFEPSHYFSHLTTSAATTPVEAVQTALEKLESYLKGRTEGTR